MKDKKTFILLNEQIRLNAMSYLAELPFDGSMQVDFGPVVKSRSGKQNRALWAVAYPPLMEHMGLRGEKDRLELHEFFCGEYWGWFDYDLLGRKKSRPVRTTTTDENGKKNYVDKVIMADFYSFIQQRGADEGVFIPDPDPMYGLK